MIHATSRIASRRVVAPGLSIVGLLMAATIGNSAETTLAPDAEAFDVVAATASWELPAEASVDPCGYACNCDGGARWFDELTFFGGIDGSKQPQDFGVNANFGGHAHFNWGVPLSQQYGLGLQVGSAIIATDNAVQVYELVGEQTSRVQNYNTLGLFQRTDSGWAWGFAYDWLNQDSFDNFSLTQWRLRGSYDLGRCDQVGVTANISDRSDNGAFADAVPVTLSAIDQGNLFWRHWWETGVQSTVWLGLADGHSEDNIAMGDKPDFGTSFLFGADFLSPLNDHFALYGETNLIMPADTGTVDAFLGVRWFPGGRAKCARRGRYAPLLPTASPTSFSVDVTR